MDLNHEVDAEEAEQEAQGQREAERRLKDLSYSVMPLRWIGESRFRKHAKAGDLIIEAYAGDAGDVEVYFPAPIVHRQDDEGGNWTWFYVEVREGDPWYKWSDVLADFTSLSVRNITANSTRELTGRALKILSLLET